MEYEVKKIHNSLTYEWLLKKHYAKRKCSISYAFGLYRNNELEGICTFGSPASHSLCIGVCGKDNKDKVLELNRLCINSNNHKNSASFLVGKALRMLNERIIVSYADTSMGHKGYIYQATNWLYTGATIERTDIDNGNGHSRHYNKNIDYSKRKHRSSKHRYIYFCGNKRFKKQMIKELNYEVQPYPKGDTKRYDCIDIKWNNDGLF